MTKDKQQSYNIKRAVGYAMIAGPLIGYVAFCSVAIGFWTTILVFAGIIAFCAWIILAVGLIQ